MEKYENMLFNLQGLEMFLIFSLVFDPQGDGGSKLMHQEFLKP